MNELIRCEGVWAEDKGPYLLVLDETSCLDPAMYGREAVVIFNQGGHDCTHMDVRKFIQWLRANRPDLLEDR